MKQSNWNKEQIDFKSRLESTINHAPSAPQFANPFRSQSNTRQTFTKQTRWSLSDEGISNRRDNYNRGLKLNQSAIKAKQNSKVVTGNSIGRTTISNSIYDGNAARKLNAVPKPKTSPKPKQQLHAIKGAVSNRNASSAAMSPMFVSIAKIFVVVVLFVAFAAFVRVGLTSAAVSLGINSQQIQNEINDQMVSNNALEVQNSALSNSSRIRQAATDYKLVAPATISVIDLKPDVLAYDANNNVSLVESLNRVANTQK